MFEIVRSKKESDIRSNFVALGYIKFPNNTHSGFVIQFNKKLFEFHYTSKAIELINLSNDYYHKRTLTIHKDEVASFIAYCKDIQKNANPKYGFFYSGESYDKNGVHQSTIDLGERMTCVGFCVNVLKGFLEEEYLNYEDWDENSHNEPDYLTTYCENHNLDISKVRASHRRISPIEFITSGFFQNLPIKKQEIDSKIEDVAMVVPT